jgi:hypothetical protein
MIRVGGHCSAEADGGQDGADPLPFSNSLHLADTVSPPFSLLGGCLTIPLSQSKITDA